MTARLYWKSIAPAFRFPTATPSNIAEHLKSEVDEVIYEIDRPQVDRVALREEIGDVLACLMFLCHELEMDPEQILLENALKLEMRALNPKKKKG